MNIRPFPEKLPSLYTDWGNSRDAIQDGCFWKNFRAVQATNNGEFFTIIECGGGIFRDREAIAEILL